MSVRSPTPTKLQSVLIKANFALGMVKMYRDDVRHPGALWYHSIAMFNAFYALKEELNTTCKNGNDRILWKAVDDWQSQNKGALGSFFGNARYTATHQGAIQVESDIVWELNTWNDTEHPVMRSVVSVDRSTITKMTGEEFLLLCSDAITFIRDGIRAINADYVSKGGVAHALPIKNGIKDEDLF